MERASVTGTMDQIINKLRKLKGEYRDRKKELSKSGAGRCKNKAGLNYGLSCSATKIRIVLRRAELSICRAPAQTLTWWK